MNEKRPQLTIVTPNNARSQLMARVKREDTAPEVALRSILHKVGYRYRIRGGTGMPGTPDLVLRRFRVAIFVDGCFWHGCPRHGSMPKTNTDFWAAKILRNRARDRQVDHSLRNLGWRVLRVCERDIYTNAVMVLARVKQLTQTEVRGK